MNENPSEFKYSRAKNGAISIGLPALVFFVYITFQVVHSRPQSAAQPAQIAHFEHTAFIFLILFATIGYIVVLLGIGVAVFYWKTWQNEKIALNGDVVTWTNWKGKTQVRFSMKDVIPNSFKESVVKNGKRFEVKSNGGDLKWSSDIDNCQALVEMFSTDHEKKHSGSPANRK